MPFVFSFYRLLFLCIGLCLVQTNLQASSPKVEQLLEGVRLSTTLQHARLTGHLRKESKRYPLTLTLQGKDIAFQFYKNGGWSGFFMRFLQGEPTLFETTNGKATPFDQRKISTPILGSDLSYEDLSLRFLYWKNARIEGEENIKMQPCHRIRLINPDHSGRYAIVYIWVHKQYEALMQVAGYDAKGRLLKRFHVTDLMRVGNTQTIKKMNIESYAPGSNKTIGITYLEFSSPKSLPRKKL